MYMLKQRTVAGMVGAIVGLVVLLSISQPLYVQATTPYITIEGHWLISQAAAGATAGKATQVVACGDFTLDVISASAPSIRGTFTGTFASDALYNPKPLPLTFTEPVGGSWMIGSILGQTTVRAMFSGTSPPIAGSFASPAVQPTPSTPDPSDFGCTGLSGSETLFGFVKLPAQGTEGMFIYSTDDVSSFPS